MLIASWFIRAIIVQRLPIYLPEYITAAEYISLSPLIFMARGTLHLPRKVIFDSAIFAMHGILLPRRHVNNLQN